MSSLEKTTRSKVKRTPKRASYERATVNEIIDAAYLCHVAFMHDEQPFVLPTACWRIGDDLFIHGARVGRMMKAAQSGPPLCISITHLDGFVLARSAFHHSINYRSVVLFGRPRSVEGEEKTAALRTFINHIVPDRWPSLRPMNEVEFKATEVLAVPITEGSAKVRTGPPVDDKEDYELPIWAGVLPIKMVAEAPITCERVEAELPIPGEVLSHRLHE